MEEWLRVAVSSCERKHGEGDDDDWYCHLICLVILVHITARTIGPYFTSSGVSAHAYITLTEVLRKLYISF